MKILLVEDDESTAALLSGGLTSQHYLVNTTDNGQTGLELVKAYDYDLIVLDIELPDLDGINLCREIRALGRQMPILMLTVRDQLSDRISGLEAGADDYLVKPFALSEVVARVRALLRRRVAAIQTVLTWGALHLDLTTCEVTYGGRLLHLTPKEYGLLELFLRSPSRLFTRSMILNNVWAEDEFPSERAVNTQIKGLRQKLKAAGMHEEWLETVYGAGYRLKAPPAQAIASAQSPAAISTSFTSSSASSSSSATPSEQISGVDIGLEDPFETELWGTISLHWERFHDTLDSRMEVFAEAVNQLSSGHFTPDTRQQAIATAHQLVGALGTFGLVEGSALARKIERVLHTMTSADPSNSLKLGRLVKRLNRVISLAPTHPLLATPQAQGAPISKESQPNAVGVVAALSLPETAAEDGQGRTHVAKSFSAAPDLNPASPLLLISADPDLRWQIQTLLAAWGMTLNAVTDIAQARMCLKQQPIHSILLDLGDAPIPTESLDFVMAIANQNDVPPMVVITQPDTASDRQFIELLPSYTPLPRPVSANALLKALTQAAHRTIAAHKRVLVFDRDRPTLTHITNQLQGWGLQVTACYDASLIWDGLSPPRHDLLIMGIDLDENRPIELCRQLRNAPDWQSVPILIAAPYDTIEPLHRAFRNGATDILSKPVFTAELMARVLRILQKIP